MLGSAIPQWILALMSLNNVWFFLISAQYILYLNVIKSNTINNRFQNMNKITITFCIIILLFLSTPLFAQFIALQDGDKVEVRDIKGGYITSGYYSGLKEIAQGDNIIILWYDSDKVEVRGSDLKYFTSGYYSNLKKISATADYAVLYYDSGKIEVRDKDLTYFSSWYQ